MEWLLESIPSKKFSLKKDKNLFQISVFLNSMKVRYFNYERSLYFLWFQLYRVFHGLEQGMQNIRSAGQMWPAEDLYLARTAKILSIYLVCLIWTPFEMGVNVSFWPFYISKRNFRPAMRFELCTPSLNLTKQDHYF